MAAGSRLAWGMQLSRIVSSRSEARRRTVEAQLIVNVSCRSYLRTECKAITRFLSGPRLPP